MRNKIHWIAMISTTALLASSIALAGELKAFDELVLPVGYCVLGTRPERPVKEDGGFFVEANKTCFRDLVILDNTGRTGILTLTATHPVDRSVVGKAGVLIRTIPVAFVTFGMHAVQVRNEEAAHRASLEKGFSDKCTTLDAWVAQQKCDASRDPAFVSNATGKRGSAPVASESAEKGKNSSNAAR